MSDGAPTTAKPLRIATWNVNSINARLGNVVAWLRAAEPDIVLLQEIKCLDDGFPRLEIEALGYMAATHGQKGYNGVAILSRQPIDQVTTGLPGNPEDFAGTLRRGKNCGAACRLDLSAQRQSRWDRKILVQARLDGTAAPAPRQVAGG